MLTSDIRRRRSARIALAVAILGAGAGFLATRFAFAATTVNVVDVAPQFIKASSESQALLGIKLTSNCVPSCDALTGLQFSFVSIQNFVPSDILGGQNCTGSTTCGVQFWQDTSITGSNADTLDAGDTLLSTAHTFASTTCTTGCTATISIPSTALDAGGGGGDVYNFFLAVRTSSTLGDGDRFRVETVTGSFTTTPAPTTVVPTVASSTIEADTVAPAVPTVTALGVSTQIGVVRVGGTAVGSGNGRLELWKSTGGDCSEGLSLIARSAVISLASTNADLITDTAAITTTTFGTTDAVCYRALDEALNQSALVHDGVVPSQPSAADVTLLSASNVSGVKRIYAGTDSAARTFRTYIKAGGAGSYLRAGTSVANAFAEVTTSASAPTNSGTTNIVQFGTATTLAAGDLVAYGLVNSNGNVGAVRDDGSIPSAPVAGDQTLLSVSAADGHQRLVAAVDASPGRTLGLYVDTAGGTSWARAVTSSGGTTPVRVTTAATAADSGTTAIFAGGSGTTALAATHTVAITLLGSGGNESGAVADGSIPAVPVASDLALSDALDQISATAVGASTKIALHAGSAGQTASQAYGDGTPEGEITAANTPVSIADLAAASTIYYSTVSTASGNESALTSDGTVPAAPVADDLTLLSTSAATDHQRVLAAVDASPGRTFRLYLDTAGGTAWARASTTSGGTTPVEVTTAGTAADSGTTTIFAGTTALAGTHAVGYARTDSNGNDSDATADGTIPAAPSSTTVSVSDALDQFVASGASASNRVDLYVAASGATPATAYDGTPDGSATATSPVSITDPTAGQTLFYTAVTVATGNESTTTSDGSVPAVPSGDDVGLLGVSDVTGNERSTATADSSGPRTFRLYLDPAGGTAWARAVTTSGGSTPVQVTTAPSATGDSGTTTVFAGATQLAAAHAAGHALVDANGNDSDVTADGAVPAVADVSLASASAANDTVTSTEASATVTVRAFLSTSSEASTAYGEGVDQSLDATQTKALDSTAGDNLFYTKVNAAGNESEITADGSIPAPIAAADTLASDALNHFVVPGASAASNVRIFVDPSNVAATAYGNGVDVTADESPESAAEASFPATEFVYYTVLTVGSGNESAITADGTIPNAPTGVSSALSASAAEQTVRSSLDSTSRTVRLYGDPAGGTSYVRATTTAGGSTFVELTTLTSTDAKTDPGIFLSGAALDAGAAVAYARVDTGSGNDSDVETDGTIPAAPTGAEFFGASAAGRVATIAAGGTTGAYRVYKGATRISIRVTHTNGTPSEIPISDGETLSEGDAVGYSVTSNNESPVLADGTIPAPPAAGSATGSAKLDEASSSVASSAENIVVYAGLTDDPDATYDEGRSATLANATPAAVDFEEGDRIFVAKRVAATGNESAMTASGTIPAAPSLPAASSLIEAADGGAGAPAATVNSLGNAAVVLRPAVLASATGAGVGLYVEKGGTTVRGTAFSTSGSVTPAFGGSTANVSYGSTGQNATTGSLDLSGLADGTDVSVEATRFDTQGNESAGSAPVAITIDTTAPGAPTGNAMSPAVTPTEDTTPGVTGSVDGATARVDVSFDGPGTVNDRSLSVTPSGGAYAVVDGTYGGTPLNDASYTVSARAFDSAGNFASATVATDYIVDTAAPDPPSKPDLVDASDTGRLDDDDVTMDTTPTFEVTTEPAAEVRLFVDGVQVASVTADGSGLATATSTTLLDGAHTITAKAVDAAAHVSGESVALTITIDTVAPAAPAAPDLQAASDHGVSSTDDLTNDATPTLDVSGSAGFVATIYEGTTSLGTAVAPSSGIAAVTTSSLADGAHPLTASLTDQAGNESAKSTARSVTVDTVAPSAPGAAPDLVAASDTGDSSTDDITRDTMPALRVTGVEIGGAARLYLGSTLLGSADVGAGTAADVTSSALADGTHDLAGVSMDAAGNESAAGPTLPVTIDASRPTGVGMTGPSIEQIVQTDTSYPIEWTGTDTGSGVTGYDVDIWQGNHNGGSRDWREIRRGTASTTMNIRGNPGGTHCFRVRAHDLAGNQSLFSGKSCTVLPVDDAALTATTSGWSRVTSSGFYLGTATHAFASGSTIGTSGVIARRIALVVTRCSDCGVVDVFQNGVRLARVDLRQSTHERKAVVHVTTAASGGEILVRKVSGRVVQLDGLALGRF